MQGQEVVNDFQLYNRERHQVSFVFLKELYKLGKKQRNKVISFFFGDWVSPCSLGIHCVDRDPPASASPVWGLKAFSITLLKNDIV